VKATGSGALPEVTFAELVATIAETFIQWICVEMLDISVDAAPCFIEKLPTPNVAAAFWVVAKIFVDVLVPYPWYDQFHDVGDGYPVVVSVNVTGNNPTPIDADFVNDDTSVGLVVM
jgi:hypothetical protein